MGQFRNISIFSLLSLFLVQVLAQNDSRNKVIAHLIQHSESKEFLKPKRKAESSHRHGHKHSHKIKSANGRVEVVHHSHPLKQKRNTDKSEKRRPEEGHKGILNFYMALDLAIHVISRPSHISTPQFEFLLGDNYQENYDFISFPPPFRPPIC